MRRVHDASQRTRGQGDPYRQTQTRTTASLTAKKKKWRFITFTHLQHRVRHTGNSQ